MSELTLYKFPPIGDLPSASTFCIKLETYFRMRNIPYTSKALFNHSKSPKQKLPYIEHDGLVLSDSSLIIDHYEKNASSEKNSPALDGWLSPLQKADALAYKRLTEEHLYFVLAYAIWVDEANWPTFKAQRFSDVPSLVRPLIAKVARRMVKKQIWTQGVGRHSQKELYKMGADNLNAIALYLADKPYFMGDKPSTIDASIYGLLSALLSSPSNSLITDTQRANPQLDAYVTRIKAQYWD